MCRSLHYGRTGSMRAVGWRTIRKLQHSFAGPSAPLFCTYQIAQGGKHESTHLYDNGPPRFRGCHRVTTRWARAKQSVAGDVETQSREIDLSARPSAEELHLQLPSSRSKYHKHR